MHFRFNDEQNAALVSLDRSEAQITLGKALSGTGKTTMLHDLASEPLADLSVRYFVFSTRNAQEERGSILKNLCTSLTIAEKNKVSVDPMVGAFKKREASPRGRAHRSKGMECDRALLLKDFHPP